MSSEEGEGDSDGVLLAGRGDEVVSTGCGGVVELGVCDCGVVAERACHVGGCVGEGTAVLVEG